MKLRPSRLAARAWIFLRARPASVGIAAVLSLFFFYSVQRTLVTSAGYRLGKLQAEHRRLLNENHYLNWSRIRAVSRESLEDRAKQAGLRTPKPEEEILVIVRSRG